VKRAPHDTQAACDETQRWLLTGGEGEAPGVLPRAERHLGRCSICQLVQTRISQTRDQLRAATPPLDDVRRARMHAQMSPALDELAARSAAADAAPARIAIAVTSALRQLWRGRGRALLIGGAAMAVTAGLFVIIQPGLHQRAALRQARAPGPIAPPAKVAAVSPAVAAAAAAGAAAAAALASHDADPTFARLEPFRVTTQGVRKSTVQINARASTQNLLLGGHFDRLDVPAGTTVRARLGRQARVSLIGPAHLEVTSSDANAIEVWLDHGQLVADYDHAAGGRLRVRSPDGVTDVIGTLFSVDVDHGHSRVAVARGRVWVEGAAGSTQILAAGQSWDIGKPAVQPLAHPARVLLEAHAREVALASGAGTNTRAGITASTARAPIAALAAASPPAPHSPPLTAPVAPEATTLPGLTPPPVVAPAPTTAPPVMPAPVAPVATTPVPVAPPPTTPAGLYRAAEADMRRRDWRSAQQRLAQVVATGSHDPIEDVARYELAQLALRQGDRAQAQRHIEDLLASDREPALREPARYLSCEMKAEAGDILAARACFAAFRQQQPGSAHDRAALGWLVRLAGPGEICGSARTWIDEYLRRYPTGPEAAIAADRKGRCPR
jgi:TolA-binding protein